MGTFPTADEAAEGVAAEDVEAINSSEIRIAQLTRIAATLQLNPAGGTLAGGARMGQRKFRLLITVIDLHGGAGIFGRNLAAGLKTSFGEEFHITLLLHRPAGLLPEDRHWFDQIEILNSRVHTDWRRLFETLLHAWRLRRAIPRLHADLILTIGTYANLLTPFAARRTRVILTVHSHSSRLVQDSPFKSIITALMRWRYPRQLIVGPSQGVVDDLRKEFGAREARVIHHGVPAERIRSLATEPVDDLPAGPYMVACGRLTAAKDYPTMLRAFAVARSRGLRESLVIVGDGEQRGALLALVRQLQLCDAVHFIGHRDNPFPYLRAARFFVLSSVWEGFGLSLLEAMTLALPCVSTDCPSGPAEVLEHGRWGLLVPPENPSELADAMLRLANDEMLRQELSRKSLERAEQLSLQNMVREYRQLFLENPNDQTRMTKE